MRQEQKEGQLRENCINQVSSIEVREKVRGVEFVCSYNQQDCCGIDYGVKESGVFCLRTTRWYPLDDYFGLVQRGQRL